MKVLSSDAQASAIELSQNEIAIINNALNEVCNGIHLNEVEFATRMGCSREEARGLLAAIHSLG